MKIMITGGQGYIGSILVRRLLNEGHEVVSLDSLMFGNYNHELLLEYDNFRFHYGSILNITDVNKAMEGAEAVVHLAAIVGDPACGVKKDLAIETNYLATVNLATVAKMKKINRFVFLSSCSVYGASDEHILDEQSALNPVSLYAQTKIQAEEELIKLSDDDFKPTSLRLATLYGLSPRMRFDLVINYLTQRAIYQKNIFIFGGDQWRPFLHVADVSKAIMCVLKAPKDKVGGQIFNVGCDEENYQLKDIGALVSEIVPDTIAKNNDKITDPRSYRVTFKKIKEMIDFTPDHKVPPGIKEIKKAIDKGIYFDPDHIRFYNNIPSRT